MPTSLEMGLGPRERPALLVGLLGGAFFAGRLGASSKRIRLAEAAEVVAAAHVEVVGVALIVAAAAQAAQHLVLVCCPTAVAARNGCPSRRAPPVSAPNGTRICALRRLGFLSSGRWQPNYSANGGRTSHAGPATARTRTLNSKTLRKHQSSGVSYSAPMYLQATKAVTPSAAPTPPNTARTPTPPLGARSRP